jgi:ribonuclease VapC
MGAPSKFELFLVMGAAQGEDGVVDARLLLDRLGIEVVDWTSDLADLATNAFLRLGKRRHRAGLNFGDCMAYALAKALDAPLLFKSDDFALTDIRRAL